MVTDDVAGARERVNETFAIYATLPSYAAMLAREGVAEPAGVALIGSRDAVMDQLHGVAEAGVSEFSVVAVGTADEQEATFEVALQYERETRPSPTGH